MKPETIEPNSIDAQEDATSSSKLRVAAYGFKNADLYGVEDLRKYYSTYISSNPNWCMVGIFLDNCKAKTPIVSRCAFKKMLQKYQKGEIDLILVRSITCFTRNMAEFLRHIQFLKDLEIEIWFEREGISTTDLSCNISRKLIARLAEEEVQNLERRGFGWPAGRKVFIGKEDHV